MSSVTGQAHGIARLPVVLEVGGGERRDDAVGRLRRGEVDALASARARTGSARRP